MLSFPINMSPLYVVLTVAIETSFVYRIDKDSTSPVL
jgi:hypothetical protein